jgi:two-component system CheB/CheR fusion protein
MAMETNIPADTGVSSAPLSTPLLHPAQSEEAGSAGVAAAPPIKVLVADDHADFANSIARLLNLWGHETQIAGDGLAAVETAEAFQPDFLLLDLKMPGLDGYQVCQRVRATSWGARTRIAIITGAGEEALLKRGNKPCFDEQLQKPVDLDLLRKLISGLRD